MRIFQKLLIITVIVIFRDNEILKGMLTLVFIMVYGVLTYALQPSENKRVQNLDLLSTLIQTLSIILAMTTIDNEFNWMIITTIIIVLVIDLTLIILILSKLVNHYYIKYMIGLLHQKPNL